METGKTDITVQDIEKQLKPLSKNAVAAFFQKFWRGWLSVWYGFTDKHPKLGKRFYQIAFFLVFSIGITIYQYIMTLFLPRLFGPELAAKEFLWPKIPMYKIDGVQKYWSVWGYAVAYNSSGAPVIGGGLGYFLAIEIATFTAQVINFPLQRNITFKSRGNPYFQAMWYFIGWILLSVFCNVINSLWLPLGAKYLPFAVYNILTVMAMSWVSMIIFFFIFLIIFPDYNAVKARAHKKLGRLETNGAPEEKLAAAQKAYGVAALKAERANAEKAEAKAVTQANAKAIAYFAILKRSRTEKDEKLAAGFNAAAEAIAAKAAAIKAREKIAEDPKL